MVDKDMDYDDSETSGGWISWFCNLEGHEFFCEIDEEYIKDSFNLYGLKQLVPKYDEALEMILSVENPDSEDLCNQNFLEVYQSAMDIYGLIHLRYIITAKGLHIMRSKFMKGIFGSCPRVLCERQLTLPVGMSEDLSTSRVKVFCPKCEDVYVPRNKIIDIDGAYFGCSFPHIFFQTFQELLPQQKSLKYSPKIYGFKIFGKKCSKYEGKTVDEIFGEKNKENENEKFADKNKENEMEN